jgi:hypothetical protein
MEENKMNDEFVYINLLARTAPTDQFGLVHIKVKDIQAVIEIVDEYREGVKTEILIRGTLVSFETAELVGKVWNLINEAVRQY